MKLLKTTYIITALVLSSNASATLIDNNYFTTDTTTGLDWLDLTETVNLSYDYVSSQFGSGGEFEGWALASRLQVRDLLDNAGGSGTYDGWSTGNNGVVTPLLGLWGDFSTDSQNNSVHFIFDEVDTFNRHALAYLFDTTKSTQGLSNDFIKIDNGYWTDTSASSQVGSALVRISSVPIPASIWLFCSGLVGLLHLRRKS